jgi:hypothetical protein
MREGEGDRLAGTGGPQGPASAAAARTCQHGALVMFKSSSERPTQNTPDLFSVPLVNYFGIGAVSLLDKILKSSS